MIGRREKQAAPDVERNRELALIHLGAKALDWDRHTYEQVLWTLARVRSAGDLDEVGRKTVIAHMKRVGFRPSPGGRGRTRPNEWAWVDKAAASKRPMLRKIIVMTRSRGKAYADGMARKMFHVERLEFADEAQLHAIVSALVYDAKRHAR